MQNQEVRLSLKSNFPARVLYHWQFINLIVLVIAFLVSGCGTSKAVKNAQQSAREAHEIQKPIQVRTSLNDKRPKWTRQTSYETDDGLMYFTGGYLNGADYSLTIRCANAEALKVAIQSISQFIRAEFTHYVKGSNLPGREVDRYVEDGIATFTGSLHMQGLRQREIYYEEVFSPSVMSPAYNVTEARNSAIDNAARQILSAVNVEYTHHYLDRIYGNVRNPKRSIEDQLSKVAKGVVLGVERRIVKSAWSREASRRYVYFILVQYPDRLVSEMRRLSKGAKVVCQLLSTGKGQIEIRLSEVNGVAVTLSSMDITIRKVNRYAGFISYYIMKVPKGSVARFSQAIAPVRVCRSSTTVTVKLPGQEIQLSDYLLGADLDVQGIIRGNDEIGRAVAVKVDL